METLQNCIEIDLAPLNQDSGDKPDQYLGDTTDTSIESDDNPPTPTRPSTPFPNTPNTPPHLQPHPSNDYLNKFGSFDDGEANTVETQSSLATKLKALILMIKLGSTHMSTQEESKGADPDRLSYVTTCTSRTTSHTSMTIIQSSLPSIPLTLCNRLMLHPTGVGIQYWNMIICLVVVYNLIFLPVRFAFPYFQERFLPFWYFLDILADLYYLLDIAIQLRTSYLEQGCIVEDWKPIALHYIFSKIFLLDVITILPLDIFRIEGHTTAYHNYIIFLRFIRFLKAYKILIFVDRIEARSDQPNIIRIVAQVVLLITIIHINACIYFLISTLLGYGSGPFSWAYPGVAMRKPLNANGSLFLDVTVPDYTTLDQYLNCLHWSTQMLTTIGEVNAPSIHIEYIYATFLLLFGVLMFATLVGNVGTIITNLNAARTRFESRLDNVKQYMDDRNINKVLKESVLRWFDHLWEKSRGIDEQETLQNLPNKLRARIAFNANRKILSDNPIYKAGDEGFKIDLMVRLRSELFPPNEKIYEKGHIGNEMYIIRTGTVELSNRADEQLPIEIEEGEYFGISCIINFDEFGGERLETATTIGFCDLLVLEKKDLLELLVDYPNVKVELGQKFAHFHKQGRGAKKRIEIQQVCKYVEKLSSHYDNLEREFQRLSTEHDRLQARYPSITI